MNMDSNIDDFPRLSPPDVVYEHKEALKKHSKVIPLFVKITSAAAVIALLLGALWWWHPTTPKQPLTAELTPVEATGIPDATQSIRTESQARFIAAPRKVLTPKCEPERPATRPEMQLIPMTTSVETPQLPLVEVNPEVLLYKVDALAYLNGIDDATMALNPLQEAKEGFFSSVHELKTQFVASIQQLNSYTIQPFTLSLRKIRDYDFDFHPMER